MGNVSTFGSKLLRELRALGEGTIRIAVWLLLSRCQTKQRYTGKDGKRANLSLLSTIAVRGMSSFGSDLTEFLLGEVGEVMRVGVSHIGSDLLYSLG